MKHAWPIYGLIASLSTSSLASSTTWNFDTDPFASDWIKQDHSGRWSAANVHWNSAAQQVELTVTSDAVGGIMSTTMPLGPGQFDVRAKIIAAPGVASCVWTYAAESYYSEIDLELTSVPSHQSASDQQPGSLIVANDTCPGYPEAQAASEPSARVARFTVYNHNPNSEYRYATAWQDVTRHNLDLSQEIMRTYRIKWCGGDRGDTRRVEYWFGDGQEQESFILAFIIYDDKIQFYDDSIKTGGYPIGYYMERRFFNTSSPFPPETIGGQTRTQGKAYAWDSGTSSYIESDAYEFMHYTPGQMKPTVPDSSMPAPLFIGPWCPSWAGTFGAPGESLKMVVDTVTYTPQSTNLHTADVNEDGTVDIADREAIDALLGTCQGDSDTNGTIDVDDLMDLLSRWGACQ
ncbi:MAG: hypothetical protein MK077_01025 [Phycisphaerales bacterium]|nr:hypothetical protein [Phycisphaerales bacterium]